MQKEHYPVRENKTPKSKRNHSSSSLRYVKVTLRRIYESEARENEGSIDRPRLQAEPTALNQSDTRKGH
ncbi:hypothetical protein OUZ56_007879 [Daphnia magna]|uniref:Uncharacterized protein n=1 Tax=Daphnia magna TaxID=35525 RepID=A0ABR0AB98_9CRUS|nr:hypothetical protein OUZ56_007879 [Daphnia magna]